MKNTFLCYNSFDNEWIKFSEPREILHTGNPDNVLTILQRVEHLVNSGYMAAGFISYEAAAAFDQALETHEPSIFPLIWFGIYDTYSTSDLSQYSDGSFSIGDWKPSISRKKYREDIQTIKHYIREGYTYQTNYTYRLIASFQGKPTALFYELVQNQETACSAFADIGRYAICSVSPELFFKLDEKFICSVPMKGTAHRGRFLQEDEQVSNWLYHSGKNRSENIMIVDMIRNDIGKIADTGSIKVNSLYDIETYPTAFQMTSTVSGKTQAGFADIFQAMFPPGSITGAPKPSTMQIIAELETTPRNVYTGCMGFILPDNKAQFNVAIRTVLIDKEKNKAEYGVGGGILWESETDEEWQETQTKARVLMEKRPVFQLLETMLWTRPEGFFLLEYHLERMQSSARYFNFPFPQQEIVAQLNRAVDSAESETCTVRLLLNKNSDISVEVFPKDQRRNKKTVKLCLSAIKVHSENPFLFHKTTYRDVYERAKAAFPDHDDVVLINEREEVTETTIYNIILRVGSKYYTPKRECGLLAGTFRAYLLENNKIKEAIVQPDDLYKADELFVINSVRKWQKAVIKSVRL